MNPTLILRAEACWKIPWNNWVAADPWGTICSSVCVMASGHLRVPSTLTDHVSWNCEPTPFERAKQHNILAVFVVPRSKAPFNLVYFLCPAPDKLKPLAEGRSVVLWKAKTPRVREHVVFLEADLVALSTFCQLWGYNALSPCRLSVIYDTYASEARHMYYHSIRHRECITTQQRLWYPSHLPTPHSDHFKYLMEGRTWERPYISAAEQNRRCNYLEVPFSTALVAQWKHICPFQRFPINFIHLLFENIVPDNVSIFLDIKLCHEELAALHDKFWVENVNRRLNGASVSIRLCFRRPRIHRDWIEWNAPEWKCFLPEMSLIVPDRIIRSHIMDGWALLVQFSTLRFRWSLTRNDVTDVSGLTRNFFNRFTTTYYRCFDSRMKTFMYTYHLLLHCDESITHFRAL